jgi:hypothetical protein
MNSQQHESYKPIEVVDPPKQKKPRVKKNTVTKKEAGGVFFKKTGNFTLTFD